MPGQDVRFALAQYYNSEVKMLEITNLNKNFKNKTILSNLNLKINNGEILALVGKNGAGKSTLIRIISKILSADSGEIITDKDCRIGVLLGGDVMLYNYLTGYEIINYFGRLNNLSENKINEIIDDMDKTLSIKSFLNNKSKTYSRGMRQKIAFVISLLNNPNLLLLDEPSTGLDLEVANDVINYIKYLKSLNKTILIATHNIFEISDLSDKIAFLSNGSIKKIVDTKEFFKGKDKDSKNSALIKELGD